jgi:hypothetical protein
VDLGLALLEIARKPGQSLTAHDIAAWCDCTRENVLRIERRALMKLRNIMRARNLAHEFSVIAPKRRPDDGDLIAQIRVPRDSVELPLKRWLLEVAKRENVTPGAIWMRMCRHPELKPPMRRINRRVIMVQIAA